jgi:hypothetical protein
MCTGDNSKAGMIVAFDLLAGKQTNCDHHHCLFVKLLLRSVIKICTTFFFGQDNFVRLVQRSPQLHDGVTLNDLERPGSSAFSSNKIDSRTMICWACD